MSSERKKLRAKALEQADPDCAAILAWPSDGFSAARMERFLAGGVEVPPGAQAVRELFSQKGMKAFAGESLEFAGRLDDDAAGDDGESPLPDHFTRLLPVMGGTTVVVVFEKLNKIGVFDMQQGRISRFITPPGTGMAVAAGGRRLMLVDPREITWRVYDLADESAGSTTMTRKGGRWELLDAEMSPYRSDLAWFVFKEDGGGIGVALCALDRKEPFIRLPIPVHDTRFAQMMDASPDFAASATGLTLIGHRKNNSHSTDLLRLDPGTAAVAYQYNGRSTAGFRASAHPGTLVTTGGLLKFPDLEQVWRPGFPRGLGVLPIFGSESFLFLSRAQRRTDGGELRVLHLPEPDGKADPVAIPLDPVPADSKKDSAVRRFPYYVHAAAGSRRVAVFDNPAKSVRIVTLPEIAGPGPETQDGAVPGGRFSRVLELPDGKQDYHVERIGIGPRE